MAVVRPRLSRSALLVLLWFGAASSVAGGVLGVAANGAGVPLSYLDGTPFSSFLLPGIVLGVVVGGTQAVAAFATLRRHPRDSLASAIAGFGMIIWIFVELAVIGEYSPLQTVYFVVGVLELALVLDQLGVTRRLLPH